MNVRLLSKLMGILCLLLGLFMLLSLAWAHPGYGFHTDRSIVHHRFEKEGFQGLLFSSLISCLVGGLMFYAGRNASMRLYRKEAMAVVGLSWVLATVLGALPFILSGTCRGPSIRAFAETQDVVVATSRWQVWRSWDEVEPVTPEEFSVLEAMADCSARGLSESKLRNVTGLVDPRAVFEGLKERREFRSLLISPSQEPDAPVDRVTHFRLSWVRMGLVDSVFESQSGFSTTGATVICDLEDPYVVPRSILFWRASTHFLGGLGIIVLFVVLLGQGSAGKALMRAEMPGPTQDNSTARMQHNAWKFAALYVGLNVILAILLKLMGMSVFDALCHAFATMATGGFSTYNASLGHFVANLSEQTNAIAIEYTVIIFMVLAGTNFTLLFLTLLGQAFGLVGDVEFRTYIGIIVSVTAVIVTLGMVSQDNGFGHPEQAVRAALFQTVSIITTTGYGTSDFDSWNQFARAILLVCMFVGGCAGSTGGGMKVIRHVLFAKIVGMEVEHAFRPKVVQLLKLSGKPVEDQTLRHSILVYFGLIIFLCVVGWLLVVFFEPDITWGTDASNKLLDSASAVIATLNNIGPGLGLVGPTSNYADFSFLSKTIFVLLMMLGRLEIFPIIVLFVPGFWRDQ